MKKSILIVEDEFIVANDLACFIEEKNFDVLGIASSVQEALLMINKQVPYIVLLDIHLKEKLTGIDLAKELQLLNIPFIYLSAYSNKNILEQAKKTNPYGFLVKPFREKDLSIALEIAAYHIELNSDISNHLEKQLTEKLSNIHPSDKLEELFEETTKTLQQYISFDFLFYHLISSDHNFKLGFNRIGKTDYQNIGVNEISTISGLTNIQVEEIIEKRKQLNIQGIYDNGSFEKLKKDSQFDALISSPFKLNSNMSIHLNLGKGKSLDLVLYTKDKGYFVSTKLNLFKGLEVQFANILENKLLQKGSKKVSPKTAIKKSKRPSAFKNLIGESPEFLHVLRDIECVAPMKTSVLIMGESGTGKELFAKCIHQLSTRSKAPFITVNCGAIPENLIESSLFGHIKGAFTGALTDHIGKFEQAQGGTIFLDEIGEMSLDMQVRLLRVLQESEIERIGDTKTISIDVRVIAATNKNLEQEIETGNFRLDLYYRLHVFPINTPRLAQRKEDIPVLAHHFLEKYSKKASKVFDSISDKSIEALLRYDFPGNVRELENIIERAVIVENGKTLMPGNWIPENEVNATSEGFKTFETKQKEYIIEVLNYTNWRVSGPKGAAKILGMHEKTLFAKIKRLGIEKKVGLKP